MDKDRLNRKEFFALPIEERRKLLSEQAANPALISYYEAMYKPEPPDIPMDGHSTMVEPKPESRLLTFEEYDKYWYDKYHGVRDVDAILEAQRDLTVSIKDTEIKELSEEYRDLLELKEGKFELKLKEKDAECQARIEALVGALTEIARISEGYKGIQYIHTLAENALKATVSKPKDVKEKKDD